MTLKIKILKREFNQVERLLDGLNQNDFSKEVVEEIQNLKCVVFSLRAPKFCACSLNNDLFVAIPPIYLCISSGLDHPNPIYFTDTTCPWALYSEPGSPSLFHTSDFVHSRAPVLDSAFEPLKTFKVPPAGMVIPLGKLYV
ncbi:hypothetical protein Desor_2631 [Desulfosporosinus orientis DSM 765]|uniref:Uncharacterized protein n=1 Tax=Desulfosporosinus orientis (strain ATCC 19365 / DSM 765 / NCIMB 8382 / VKM B-1628 / Singapore I) TaxID=768706 RepID=G7W8X0_DESOD|nr:hypothetical protein Desor_2631 [Desulfosporosinus orientis DSM 765]